MRIAKLAAQSGESACTIRYYESVGLLPEPPRTPTGYREYGCGTIEQIRLIRALQEAGLSLAAIARLREIQNSPVAPAADEALLVSWALAQINQQLETVGQVRAQLVELIDQLGDEGC